MTPGRNCARASDNRARAASSCARVASTLGWCARAIRIASSSVSTCGAATATEPNRATKIATVSARMLSGLNATAPAVVATATRARDDEPAGLTTRRGSAQTILELENRPLGVQVAMVVLVFVLGLPIACVISLAVGIGIGPMPLVLAAVAAIAVALRRGRRGAFALLLALGVVLASCALSAVVSDVSFDGQAYHQEAILRLLAGWNPLWAAPLSAAVPYSVLLDHYPKFAEMAAAAIASVTTIETGKAIEWLLFVPSLLLAIDLLTGRGFRGGWRIVFATLVAGGPVVCDQLFTFYVDGLLASSLTVAALLILCSWHRSDRALPPIALLALLYACNLKFTGVIYSSVFVAAFLAWVWRRRQSEKRAALAWTGALALAVMIFGANPYFFNIARNGNPFFPVAGQGVPDVLEVGPSAAFRAHNRLRLLGASLLSRSSNTIGATPQLKTPFMIYSEELVALSAPDARIGGFGPWFGAALILALVLLALVRPRREWWFLLAPIVLSVLVTRAVFWARLVPQLWLVPVVIAIAAAESRWRRLGQALAIVLVADLALTTAPCLGTQIVTSHYRHRQLRALASAGCELEIDFGPFPANRQILNHDRVPFHARQQLRCARPAELIGSKAVFCFGAESPPPSPSPLESLKNVLYPSKFRSAFSE